MEKSINLNDEVGVQSIFTCGTVGYNAWGFLLPQPIYISYVVSVDLTVASKSDSIEKSYNYSLATNDIIKYTSKSKDHGSSELLASCLCDILLEKADSLQISAIQVNISMPKALLNTDCLVETTLIRNFVINSDNKSSSQQKEENKIISQCTSIKIKNLLTTVVIGIREYERLKSQPIIINLKFECQSFSKNNNNNNLGLDYQTLVNDIFSVATNSNFYTIESLASKICSTCLIFKNIEIVTVHLAKPMAVMNSKFAFVKMKRDQLWFKIQEDDLKKISISVKKEEEEKEKSILKKNIVFLGLGSNLGDRAANLWLVLDLLERESSNDIRVVDTSYMYQSYPMYNTSQPDFFNAACKIETTLDAKSLFNLIKDIEKKMGRNMSETIYGPRLIDIDILFFNNEKLDININDSSYLFVPHCSICEREFVLQPLSDIDGCFIHPFSHLSINRLLKNLLKKEQMFRNIPNELPKSSLIRILPLRNGNFLKLGKRTYIMGIINVTPDSFSDGGEIKSIENLLEKANLLLNAGADILDIGGQSTRPGASDVSEEDEKNRVLPAIQAIRNRFPSAILSIDTQHSSVAKASLEYGADILNDTSGGGKLWDKKISCGSELDDDHSIFLQDDFNIGSQLAIVAREAHVPLILMHSRGTPKTMNSHCGNLTGMAAVNEIAIELAQLLHHTIYSNRLPRWLLIADPGLGFAKNAIQNWSVLRHLKVFNGQESCYTGEVNSEFSPRKIMSKEEDHVLMRMPILVGPSRKRFLGVATDKWNPKDRDIATCAAVVGAISGGADIVRVHNVQAVRDAVKVADCIWRDNENEL